MNKRQNDDYSKLCKIAESLNLFWWEADLTDEVYILSDSLVDMLGLDTNRIACSEIHKMIRTDYLVRVEKLFLSLAHQDRYEQKFPIQTRFGVKWLHSKLISKSKDSNGHLIAFGSLQCISNLEKENLEEAGSRRVENLLFQLNDISRSFLAFFKDENIDNVIEKILYSILAQFQGGSVYLIEYDWKQNTQICSYEVTDMEVKNKVRYKQAYPIDITPWWTEQIGVKGLPVLLYDVNDLPADAMNEKRLLQAQGIYSQLLVPLKAEGYIWGYLGVDIITGHYKWTNEDYQWLVALANIINICIQLRRSERKALSDKLSLRRLYDYMPLGYIRLRIIYDDKGSPVDYIFIDANPAAAKISGHSKNDLIECLAGKSGVGDQLGNHLHYLQSVIDGDNYKEIEYRIPQSGRYCHFTLFSTQEKEVVILFSDMTDMHETHKALFNNQKILNNIYKNIPVGIELYDKEGFLIDINDKELEMFCLNDKESVLGVNLFENPNIPDRVKELLLKGEDCDFALKYHFSQAKDYYQTYGEGTIDLIAKATLLYDSQGKFINYLFINIDNTETNNAYSRIQEFEHFFSAIADFAKVGYFKWNPSEHTGFAIDQWYQNLEENESKGLENIIGIYDTLHPDDRKAMKRFFLQASRGEVQDIRREVRVTCSDGGWKWLRSNIKVRGFDKDKGITDMIGINFDITELKETEKKLIQAKEKAESMDRLKSAFLANMSHEIRTPLNAIVGFSNLLTESDDTDECTQYISIVQKNSDLLLQLISDILDLSKIEAGTFEFIYDHVNVAELCNEIIHSMSMKVSNDVNLSLSDHIPACIIYTDKNRLMQILINFISNALKFTSKGSITLGYELTKWDEIKFYVRDTGIGISEEYQKKIFERFTKLNSFAQGTGLGLSICESIVTQMGGNIGVDSSPGQGSTFWFTHPYDPGLNSFDKPEEKENGSFSDIVTTFQLNRKPVVLVAEDTDSNYLLASAILHNDYELIRAVNGQEAVNLFEEVGPDLILMDMKMPVMDGIEAVRKIRAMDKVIPIIALTAYAFEQDKMNAFSVGCNDFITKPLNVNELKDAISKHICGK